MSFLVCFFIVLFDVLLCKKKCESIIEAHVGIASLPLIKRVFDLIIILIFSVFFLGLILDA